MSTPNWMPCEVEPARSMPFCDHTRSTTERVQHLISLMTQEELCQQTYDKMGTIARVPSWQGYNWNTECLHGLGAICLKVGNTTRCPSVFPAPPAMGATFNLTIAHELGRVISDEVRAFSNANGHRSYQNRPIGVSAWGPNLNIYRDPRWGRNVEVPSEDPFHSGRYGVAYTNGLQWGDDARYTKAIGALKHYTIYSVEDSGGHGDVRGSSYFPIAMKDIEETCTHAASNVALTHFLTRMFLMSNSLRLCRPASIQGACGRGKFPRLHVFLRRTHQPATPLRLNVMRAARTLDARTLVAEVRLVLNAHADSPSPPVAVRTHTRSRAALRASLRSPRW